MTDKKKKHEIKGVSHIYELNRERLLGDYIPVSKTMVEQFENAYMEKLFDLQKEIGIKGEA